MSDDLYGKNISAPAVATTRNPSGLDRDGDPVERVLSKLENVRQVGHDQWEASCTCGQHAHEDRKPSLSISRGDDGRALLCCQKRGKAATSDILAAIGLKERDLFTGNVRSRASRHPGESGRTDKRAEHRPSRKAKTPHATERDAVKAALWGASNGSDRRDVKIVDQHRYFRGDGSHDYTVIRFSYIDTTTGAIEKDIRQISLGADGKWRTQKAISPPLFIAERHCGKLPINGTIYVVEGENCVNAADSIGMTAVTSGCAKSAVACSDWSRLTGREVVIIPDADTEGDGYAADVAKLLEGVAASVKIVDLVMPDSSDRPKGFDIADWVELPQLDGRDGEELRKIIEQMPGRASVAPSVEANEPYAAPALTAERESVAPVVTTERATDESNPPMAQADEATELRAAQIVREQFGSDIRYNADSGSWLVYGGGVWQTDVTGMVASRVKSVAIASMDRLETAGVKDAERIARALQSSRGLSAVTAILRTEPGVSVRSEVLDQDDFALNVLNGTINLCTGELRRHDRADLITRQLPFEYDPTARCPQWEHFLDTVFGGDVELIAYVQRLAGLCASGDASVQELYVLHGDGGNGKSVFVETLSYVLGAFADIAPESLLMARDRGNEHPTEIADLVGKRLVVASETESGGAIRLQLIKRMTGDGKLKARYMRQDFFHFRRTHKTLLVTNNKPRIPESTEAAWRRIRLIPFDVTIPEAQRDEQLPQKLKTEAAGILAWIVRGSVDRIDNGMMPPDAVRAATHQYKGESDSVGKFVLDELDVRSGEKLTRSQLLERYNEWAASEGESPVSEKRLYVRVRALPGITENEWKVDGKKARGFVGVKLRLAE